MTSDSDYSYTFLGAHQACADWQRVLDLLSCFGRGRTLRTLAEKLGVTTDTIKAMCRALCHVMLEAARSEPSEAALGEYLHELGTKAPTNPKRVCRQLLSSAWVLAIIVEAGELQVVSTSAPPFTNSAIGCAGLGWAGLSLECFQWAVVPVV